MKLVQDWRGFLKWYSTWANLALISVGSVWVMIPEDMRAAVDPRLLGACAIVLAVSGVVGRLIDQGSGGNGAGT